MANQTIKSIDRALPKSDDELLPPQAASEWPRSAEREANWAEAAKRWAVLRKAYPGYPGSWYQGANAYIEAGKLPQAKTLLDQAQERFPNYPQLLTISASLAMAHQDWETADNLLQQAREQHPDKLQVWMQSAQCAEKSGNLEQAIKYYQLACECAPDTPGPSIQLAELFMRAENWEQALHHWESVRKHFPDHAIGFNRAAEAARKLGRNQEARQLSLAQQYGSDFPDSHSIDTGIPKQSGRRQNIKQLLGLIWTKAFFNLRSEVHRNYLSYGWWVLEPLLHMAVYYVVFGFLLQRGGENFTTFLLTGLIPWMWFMKAVSGSSNSILAGQNLMLQVGLPSIVFPLVSTLQSTLKQIPVFILLLVFVWLQGFAIGSQWWALLPVIVVQALVVTSFACAVAAVIPFARDLSYLVPTGMTFLMFMSGIFYDYKIISEEWRDLFLLNPMAFLLKCYREIFIDGVLPDLVILAWWGLGSAIACLLLILAFQRLRYIYPRIVLE